MNHLFNLEEQICYAQCDYCTTILLVSVPCNSLPMVVTVRCGHCTSLLSVNMMRTSLLPLHLLASLNQDEWSQPNIDNTTLAEVVALKATLDIIRRLSPIISSDEMRIGQQDMQNMLVQLLQSQGSRPNTSTRPPPPPQYQYDDPATDFFREVAGGS